MTVVNDRVVLSSWNGRPTVSIDVVDGIPLLHWLVLGHTERFDIWLHASLSWEQADMLCAPHSGGFDLGTYLSSLDRVPVRYQLVLDGETLVTGESVLPGGDDAAREGMRNFVEAVREAWDSDETDRAVLDGLNALAKSA